MSSDQLLRSPARRRNGGFTMVEILVSLVIVSIFATILFQLVRGQGTFVARQGARSEAHQNARGALEIIAADLRAASAQSLVNARDNSLTLNVPRAWGVVCGTPTASQIVAVFPLIPGAMVTTVNANTGITVDASPQLDVTQLTSSGTLASVAAVDPVTSGCAPLGNVAAYRFTGSGFPQGVANKPMFIHDQITYDAAAGADGMLWIRRTHGTTQQPLAGPIPSTTGLRFTYFNMTPAVVAAPATVAANLQAVGRIRVDVSTRSRQAVNGQHQMERDSITVSLRN